MPDLTLPERIAAAYRPDVHGGAPAVEIISRETVLTLAEVARRAVAARDAGREELHLLAWEFPVGFAGRLHAASEALPLPVRLVRLPRELYQPWGRKPPLFVEAGALSIEPLRHPDGSWDVRLAEFRPGLPISPKRLPEAQRQRAEEAGFDFLDYWAVDFNHDPAGPFRHQWRGGRSSRQRRLPLQSAAHCPPEWVGSIAVKVTDVFGYETLAVVELPR